METQELQRQIDRVIDLNDALAHAALFNILTLTRIDTDDSTEPERFTRRKPSTSREL